MKELRLEMMPRTCSIPRTGRDTGPSSAAGGTGGSEEPAGSQPAVLSGSPLAFSTALQRLARGCGSVTASAAAASAQAARGCPTPTSTVSDAASP
eukprot:454140-Hanusia_phi.AAC.1